jgi:hypothetical protein
MCRIITDSVLFEDCRNAVGDYDHFYDECLYDACGCNTGGDCQCLCTAIQSFASACNQAGVPVYWRSNALCRE